MDLEKDIERISNLPEEEQEEILKSKLIPNISTETPFRKWERKLIVALTPEARQKALAKMKEYSNEYKKDGKQRNKGTGNK